MKRVHDFAMPRLLVCLALLVGSEAIAKTYTTSFPLTENPIAEGGNWINGGTVGLDWTNVRVTPGLALGTQASGGFDDSTALLTGAWGPTQTVSAVVNIVGSDSGSFEEVELRVRSSLSAHSCTGYEMNYSVKASGTYCQIVRWNGALGDWTQLDGRTIAALHTGDIVKATAVGNTLTTYINGVPQFSVTDSTFPTGNPGIGFYASGDGSIANYGFSSFVATDGIASLPVTLVTPWATNGQFGFSFQTVLGQSYSIQQNADLALPNWVTATNFIGTGLPYQFRTLTTNSRSPVGFRVREP
jgi:hypothetical protein